MLKPSEHKFYDLYKKVTQCNQMIADWFSEKSVVAFAPIFLEPWNNQGTAKDRTNCLALLSRNSNPSIKYPG